MNEKDDELDFRFFAIGIIVIFLFGLFVFLMLTL